MLRLRTDFGLAFGNAPFAKLCRYEVGSRKAPGHLGIDTADRALRLPRQTGLRFRRAHTNLDRLSPPDNRRSVSLLIRRHQESEPSSPLAADHRHEAHPRSP